MPQLVTGGRADAEAVVVRTLLAEETAAGMADGITAARLAREIQRIAGFAQAAAEECRAAGRFRDAAEHLDRWLRAAQYLHGVALKAEASQPVGETDDSLSEALMNALTPDQRAAVVERIEAGS